MGDEANEPPCGSPTPMVQVTLTHDFELGQYEVTQAEYVSRFGENPVTTPGAFSRVPSRPCDSCPVYRISPEMATAYCNALSVERGLPTCYVEAYLHSVTDPKYSVIYECPGYRLPTEAEWEYAYRSGTRSAYYNGPMASCGHDANADQIAWNAYNTADSAPQPVGQKPANGWGLFDMAGNVEEWVHDGYADDARAAPLIDPQGDRTTTQRVAKGGSVLSAAEYVRAASRGRPWGDGAGNLGFRCARTVSF